MVKKQENKELQQPSIADLEYNRLISLYKKSGVDGAKLAVNDKLIYKVAELYEVLEKIKGLPTLVIDKTGSTKETGAGKARVKYMAQYTNCMVKLNKDLLNTDGNDGNDDDDELSEFEDDD